MIALLAGGIGMLITARNDKSFKKSRIEDKDERNRLFSVWISDPLFQKKDIGMF